MRKLKPNIQYLFFVVHFFVQTSWMYFFLVYDNDTFFLSLGTFINTVESSWANNQGKDIVTKLNWCVCDMETWGRKVRSRFRDYIHRC